VLAARSQIANGTYRRPHRRVNTLPGVFTGIVEQLGVVESVERGTGSLRLRIDAGPIGDSLAIGDSVAVNGVCLTAVEAVPGRFAADVVDETVDRTSLGSLQPGDRVNLELPMTAMGRFDGHLVQGHVDAVGEVAQVSPEGDGARMRVALPGHLERYVVEKGSITIDGVSLTVAAVGDSWLEVALIPRTLEATTLGRRTSGHLVNLEVDILAKYVERLLESGEGRLTTQNSELRPEAAE
jgi:riboflavin synthase